MLHVLIDFQIYIRLFLLNEKTSYIRDIVKRDAAAQLFFGHSLGQA